MAACYRFVRPRLRRLLADHPADAIVSVHPLVNHCVCRVMRETGLRRPYVTVVTDLWTAHAFWFCPEATRIFVPTDGARDRAMACGVPTDRIIIRGLPVVRRFTEALSRVRDREATRSRLGLKQHGPVVLLIGGGDGMGPIFDIARAIDATTADLEPPPQLVVIAGRNARLARAPPGRLLANPGPRGGVCPQHAGMDGGGGCALDQGRDRGQSPKGCSPACR